MPQLDANTFIYQYIGIIFVFIVTYILLSYVILPMILRLIIVRFKFLDSHQTLNESLTSVNPFYKNTLVLSSSTSSYIYNRLNILVTHNVPLIITFLTPITTLVTFFIAFRFSSLNILTLGAHFYLILLLAYDEFLSVN